MKFLEQKIPMSVRSLVKKYLDFAGIDEPPEKWLSSRILFAFIFSLAVALPVYFFAPEENYFAIASFLVSAIALSAIFYFTLYYRINTRRERCNEMLPVFLSVVAMNLNAGMEPLSALYVSLRPDFAPITEEMKKIRSLALGHKSIIEQLSLLNQRIDSEQLRNVLAIIERAARSGGNLAALLQTTAQELDESNKLKQELKTATRGYIYFIGFLMLVGIPLLLSVASIFISVTSSQTTISLFPILTGELVPTEEAPPVQQKTVASEIDIVFSLLVILSSIAAGLMFGVVSQGEIKYGVKFVPFILFISLLAYFTIRGVVTLALKTFGIAFQG